MMLFRHRNVVLNFFRLSLFLNIKITRIYTTTWEISAIWLAQGSGISA